MAGGQIALNGRDPGQLAQQLGQLALDFLGVAPALESTPII
jgi:hypothetical protein